MKNKTLFTILTGTIGIPFFGFLFMSKLLSSPAPSPLKNADKKLQVIASFYPIYYFAREIAGDKADVKNVIPQGSEPHEYELTPKDITDIGKSRLVFIHGSVEPWEENIKENFKGQNTLIVTTGQDLMTMETIEEGTKMQDPHVWLSPLLAMEEVKKIANGFMTVDPQNSSYYQKNANTLDAKLTQIDKEFMQNLSDCKLRDFVTSHAAFGYLAKQYGLNQITISGISPDAEPSTRQLANVAKVAKEKQVKYIFFESLISPKLSETIANEIGADTLVLDPLEGLSDDDIKEGKNYFTVMRENLKNLKLALQCTK